MSSVRGLFSLGALVAAAAASTVACGGMVVDDASTSTPPDPSAPDQAAPTPADPGVGGGGGGGGGGAPAGSAAAPGADPTALPAAPALPAGGVCAGFAPLTGSIGAGGLGCVVATETRPLGSSYHSFADVKGDRGSASLQGDTLVIRCGSSERVSFQAAIRCFAGKGTYEIAAGDLILGDKSSDRACKIDVDIEKTTGRAAGFIECPNSEGEPDNVFANSGAPIGLGTYSLPLTME